MMTLDEFKTSPCTQMVIEAVVDEFKKYGVEVEKISFFKNQESTRTKDGFALGKEYYLIVFTLNYKLKDPEVLSDGRVVTNKIFMMKIIPPENGMPEDGFILKHVTDTVDDMNRYFNLGIKKAEI